MPNTCLWTKEKVKGSYKYKVKSAAVVVLQGLMETQGGPQPNLRELMNVSKNDS